MPAPKHAQNAGAIAWLPSGTSNMPRSVLFSKW
eukprot:CAMPEP_0170436988 /NCGR_PEP_ID=MMETSP0117_2-20130122/44437_1 /TAXON_ID=400756 /ORGANISM="Durinskia baltica, Strain CSIRO CS-38" /LENGTH=32 /DNA_ID= /DNA_START= /DNA_END= /DNA_ORIENTATION=